MDAAAVVSELNLNAATPTFDTTNDTGSALVQSYQLSPYAVSRLKDIGYLEARSVLAGSLISGSGNGSATGGSGGSNQDNTSLSDSLTTGAQLKLFSSPEQRSRLEWESQAGGARTTRFGAGDVTLLGASVKPEYAISHWLSMSVTGGWGLLDDGGETLQGPEVLIGGRYEPSPQFRMRASAGWRLENPEAEVSIGYSPTPTTSLSARYRDFVGVGQTTLLRTVSDLSFDTETHRFVDRGSSLPFSADLTGITLSNDLTRTRRGDLDAARGIGGEIVGIGAFMVKQEAVGNGSSSESGGSSSATNQTSVGVGGQWTHPIDRATSLSTAISFAVIEQDEDGNAGQSSGNSGTLHDVGLLMIASHQLTDEVSAFVGYRFRRRLAQSSQDEFTENAVLLGLTRRF
ncbi:MAG: hypothetical protein IPK66_12125 [Rhodospirillales bacterium]|nr:hypothetical protein [Rhodospirillales bacterium]